MILARRKGEKWYVAGINANHPRTVKIPMTFLSGGKYKATIYRYRKPGATPTETEVLVETINVDGIITHELYMPSGGGFGIIFERE